MEELLHDVCVELGFCLSPDTYDRLITDAPETVEELTKAIFVAEGMSPETSDQKLYRQVQAYVEKAFSRSNPNLGD